MIDIKKVCESRFKREEEYLGTNKLINQINPLVSVTVTTYQHANYIKDCLEGILMQKTNFPFEIIIGEDESTDGTREICIEYAEKYPDKIRLFLRKRETSQLYDENGKFITRFNGHWNRMSARGKYIAWCEGDDYWIDPYKLQKQVDFLEANPEYGMVYCDIDRLNEKTKIIEKNAFKNQLGIKENTFNDFLINAWFLAPCTWLIRYNVLNSIQYLLKKEYIVGDLPLLLGISKNSKIGYIDESMAVYRILNKSASHLKSKKEQYKFHQGIFKIQMDFAKYYNVTSIVIEKIKDNYYKSVFNLICLLNDKKSKIEAFSYLKKGNMLTKKMRILHLITKFSIIRLLLLKFN